MFDRLADLEAEFADVEARLADPAVTGDPQRYGETAKRYKELEAIVSCHRQLLQAQADLGEWKELYTEASSEDRDELRVDIEATEADTPRLEAEIQLLLLPRDPNEGKNVIVEIRGAEGG